MADFEQANRGLVIANFEARCAAEAEVTRQIGLMLDFYGEQCQVFPSYCLQLMRRARELSHQTENLCLEGKALFYIGLSYLERGETMAASGNFRPALELFQSLDDRDGIIRCLGALGSCASLGAAFEEALVCFRQAMDLAKQEPVSIYLPEILLRLARCHIERGESLLALSCLDRMQLNDATPALERAQNLFYRAVAFRCLGATDQIEGILARAKQLANLPLGIQEALNLEQVRLWQAQSQNSRAKIELDKLLNRARRMGEPLLIAECLLTEGEIWVSLDNPEAAKISLTAGLEILADTGDQVLEKSLNRALQAIDRQPTPGASRG